MPYFAWPDADRIWRIGGSFFAPDEGVPAVPSLSTTAIADETLGGGRVVRASSKGHAVYARPPELASMAPWGITAGAANSGAQVEVLESGIVFDDTWNWQPGPLMLTGNGELTQTQPSQPYVVVVGYALAPKLIVLRIGAPILL